MNLRYRMLLLFSTVGFMICALLIWSVSFYQQVFLSYCGLYILSIAGALWVVFSVRAATLRAVGLPWREERYRMRVRWLISVFTVLGAAGWFVFVYGRRPDSQIGNVFFTLLPLTSAAVPVLMLLHHASAVRQMRHEQDMLCHNCGYNLRGNVSGACPECGVCRKDSE